jgi:hypothetical protein
VAKLIKTKGNRAVNKLSGSGPIIGATIKNVNSELGSLGMVLSESGDQLLAKFEKFKKTVLALRTKCNSSLVKPFG